MFFIDKHLEKIPKNVSIFYLFRFTCPEFGAFALNKCHVKGRSFDVGQNVPDEVVPMCRADCHCSSYMHVECANVECPEDDYIDPDQAPTISLYNDLKQCCSSAQAPIDKIDNLPKCHVEGRSYHIGERIYPTDSCLMCLCTQNFDNKTLFAENSNCIQINCGIEHDLHHIRAGCVPVYYKTSTCCPIDIKCRKFYQFLYYQITVILQNYLKIFYFNSCKR